MTVIRNLTVSQSKLNKLPRAKFQKPMCFKLQETSLAQKSKLIIHICYRFLEIKSLICQNYVFVSEQAYVLVLNLVLPIPTLLTFAYMEKERKFCHEDDDQDGPSFLTLNWGMPNELQRKRYKMKERLSPRWSCPRTPTTLTAKEGMKKLGGRTQKDKSSPLASFK